MFLPDGLCLSCNTKTNPMDKTTFFTGQPVFTQLLSFIPRSLVSELAIKHQSNRYYKRFKVYDHLVTMLYAGYFQCTALREITTGLKANAMRLKHLGLQRTPTRSTLSDANRRRSVSFFSELYHQLYQYHFLPDSRQKNDRLFIIDSTTIQLFTSIMKGAGTPGRDGKKKGGAKAHMMIDAKHDIPAFVTITEAKEHDLIFLQKLQIPDFSTVVMDKAYVNHHAFKRWGSKGIKWVTRLKNGAYLSEKEDLTISPESINGGIQRDRIVLLGRPSNHKKSPQVEARVVEYFDAEKGRPFSFITNDFTRQPLEIADLYKRRWQIEILFKRIKQRYPLKYFLGENENAIQIQIWSALICDLLVRIIQRQVNKKIKRPWAYSSISCMIKHHLMSYLDLIGFLRNPDKLIEQNISINSQLSFFAQDPPYF